MKTRRLFFFLLLAIGLNAFPRTMLEVQNPDSWYRFSGKIETAQMSIRPVGIYTQCDLFLEFSSGEYLSSVNFSGHDSETDSVEVQYYFELPEGAIVTDSWLWVEDDIVVADIRDRWTANQIFEEIVDRRKDPSILYKNSETDYELRIYPLVANSTRRVKITYLLLNNWTSSSVTTDVPLNLFDYTQNPKMSLPKLDVIVYSDSIWTNPVIYGGNSISQGITDKGEAYISTSQDQFNKPFSISYDAPLTDGVFLQKFPSTATTGYYQMALLPSSLISGDEKRKVAIAFDHNSNNIPNDEDAVWESTRLALKTNLVDSDSFNVFYTQFVTKRASDTWIEATDAKIDSVFDALWANDPLRSQASLPSLLGETINFIESNGNDGSVLLVSASTGYANKESSDLFISDFLKHSDAHKINVVNYFYANYPSFYLNGSYSYGNSYLYSQLAHQTDGQYYSVRTEGSLLGSISNALSSVTENFSTYDVSVDVTGLGFTYSNLNLDNGDLFLNRGFFSVGKYFQGDGFNVSLVLETETGVQGASKDVTRFYEDKDSVTYQIWTSQKIETLGSANTSNDEIGNIIELSLEARVLTRYTAFLALDPNEFDNVIVCDVCENEVEIVLGFDEELSSNSMLTLSVFPNPVEDQMRVKINIPQGYNDISGVVQLYSMEGVLLLELDIDGQDEEQMLELALSEYGLDLESGIYLLTVQLGEFTETIKVHKN